VEAEAELSSGEAELSPGLPLTPQFPELLNQIARDFTKPLLHFRCPCFRKCSQRV
jgi:hypothetical protein